jgi:flagellin-like hook-associated protein FlgL
MASVNFQAGSLLARQWLRRNGDAASISMQRISTGLRINSAADAPSDLSRLNGSRAHVRALRQAVENVQGALSMTHIQDTALGEITDAVLRIRDLALSACNDATLARSCEDRTRINEEVQGIKDTINDIAEITTFNSKQILKGNAIESIEASNPVNTGIAGAHPTWNPAGTQTAYESDAIPVGRYPASNAWRIWSRTPLPGAATMLTTDPPNAPGDADGDGFVNHPLSDPLDGNNLYPNAPDTDGDGWPDPIDPFPADPLLPGTFADADGDGYINHPWIDANDADPSTPTNVDADGDGYVDHPWMDPDDSNPYTPNPTKDSDGDGIIDYYDRKGASDFSNNPNFPLAPDSDGDGIINVWDGWGLDPNLPKNPPDSDGDGEIDIYDPWPADPLLNAGAPQDGDGDGWPTAFDPDDADPLNPGGAPPDTDADGYIDLYDPWPTNPAANNAAPLDTDGDGIIDYYDSWPTAASFPENPDTDGDGVLDFFDYAPNDPLYPLNPPDADGDTIPDALDPQPGVPNNVDSDGDGIFDIFDPLPANPNYPVSTDADADGYPDDAGGLFDPAPGDNQYPTNVDTDLDGIPDIFDPAPNNNAIPGPNPGDADGDGFADHPLFDPDPTNPLIPFDNSIDGDGDGYPWYIDGGPGDPAGNDANPYMPLAAICYEDRDPDWGGAGIVFASNRNTYYTSLADPWVSDIFVISGGTINAVTNDANDDIDPAWSSDDKYIAWNRDGDIYYVQMSGGACTGGITGTPTLLTANGETPVWRPRENQVFFTRAGDIFYADLTGAETQLTTNLGAPVTGDNPTFMPSGDALLYTRGGTVFYFDFLTKKESAVTGASAGPTTLDVSPDSNFLLSENGANIVREDLTITYKASNVQAGGATAGGDQIGVYYADARTGNLGISQLSVASQSSAQEAVDQADRALDKIGEMRAKIGTDMKIFQTQLSLLNESVARISDYNANLGDADMAAEISSLTRTLILSNASAAQFAQFNSTFPARARALLASI